MDASADGRPDGEASRSRFSPGSSDVLMRLVLIGALWGLALAGPARVEAVNGKFAERDFPFLESSLDARSARGLPLEDNLVVRGLIVSCGEDTYACYDTDLVRLALVWKGGFLDFRSMAAHSYAHPGQKIPGGQDWLNRPLGEALSGCGLYPGGSGSGFSATDPRPPGPDPRETGKGPLPEALGRWHGTRIRGEGAQVEYFLRGALVRESIQPVPGRRAYVRNIHGEASAEELQIVLGSVPHPVRRIPAPEGSLHLEGAGSDRHFRILSGEASLVHDESDAVRLALAPADRSREVRVLVSLEPPSFPPPPRRPPSAARRLWPQTVVVSGSPVEGEGLVVDTLPLPEPNPWRRKVRASAIAFLPDGRAALSTFDGDVWLLGGIDGSLASLRWSRFASGLNEPQSLHWIAGRLHLYTRNGVVRLHDLDRDGEADWYETLSNRFTQTAETREFAIDSKMDRQGRFLLAKPGQQSRHQGGDNGAILRISADGRSSERLATGFRQPFLGYSPDADLLLASDQQGHWVPATPIHWVRPGRFYGHRPSSEVAPPQLPVTEPLCWIPHRVVQSASGLAWVASDRLGPLSRRFLCLDYYASKVMLVHLDPPRAPVQAGVSRIPLDIDLPLLKAEVRPQDGWLYLAGFRIWGSEAGPWSGLRRIRHLPGGTGFPVGLRVLGDGILLQFDRPLDAGTATDPASYHLGRWNYRRTGGYGSGHYRLDGQPGSEGVALGGAALSEDRRTVWIHVPDQRPAMQLECIYRLEDREGRPLEGRVHATLHELRDWDPSEHGFDPREIQAAREAGILSRAAPLPGEEEISLERGRLLYRTMGCMACHSLDGTTAGRSGPTLEGVFGSMRRMARGQPVLADEDYLRESLLEPQRRTLEDYSGADIGMPSYQGVLSGADIDSLILLLRSLSPPRSPGSPAGP